MRNVLTLAAVALFVSGVCEADTPQAPVKVSLTARDIPLRQALKSLKVAQGVIAVDRDVPDVPVKLTLRDIELEHALRLVVRHASKKEPRLELETTATGFRLLLAAPALKEPETPGETPAPSSDSLVKALRDIFPTRGKARPADEPVESVGDEGDMALPHEAGAPFPDVGVPGLYVIPPAPTPDQPPLIARGVFDAGTFEQKHYPIMRKPPYPILTRRLFGLAPGPLRGVLGKDSKAPSGPGNTGFPSIGIGGLPSPGNGGGGFGVRPLR
jgi:hypothetical protein